MTTAVPFPTARPPGIDWLDDEPRFDPALHLQIEPPSATTGLTEFSYDAETIAPTATTVAVSEPFRVLSDEGAAALLDTCRRLRAHAKRAGSRIENTVRGGCYRSRFLRDLCLDPSVTATMTSIYGTDVAPTRCRCISAISTTNRATCARRSTSGTTTRSHSTT